LEKAVAEFDKALAMDRRHAGALLGKGIALKLKGDKAAAREWFQKAEDADPRSDAGRERAAISTISSGLPAGPRWRQNHWTSGWFCPVFPMAGRAQTGYNSGPSQRKMNAEATGPQLVPSPSKTRCASVSRLLDVGHRRARLARRARWLKPVHRRILYAMFDQGCCTTSATARRQEPWAKC